MSDPVNVLRLGIGGMISAADSSLLDDVYYVEGINVCFVNGRIGTRPPLQTIVARVEDDSFNQSNIQGACFYNPSKGQSALTFADDFSSIIVAAAGRKYILKPQNDGTYTVENLTNSFVGKSDAHIAYVYQAEIYAIVQDGIGPTWIYDSTNDASISTGYNTVDKDESKLANGATVGGYIHGRIFQVVSGRAVLVGDIIHKTDLTDPANILNTTEQVYWATGAQFSPPSSMGNVLCGAILPLKNTTHGHGELMCHCEDGIFSIDLSQYPRSNWVNLNLVKHVTLDSAARGPYALALYSGDQIYRSRQGVHSLKSQAAQGGPIGDPDQPVSAQINNLLRKDTDELLKFCSVSKLALEERLFCTIGHELQGSYRWGQGMVVNNFSPIDGEGLSAPAWEGIWVPPYEIGGIVQMVNGIFNGKEICYALCHNIDSGINYLVRVNSTGLDDYLPDGSYRKIECSVTTRSVVSTKDPLASFTINSAILFLRNITGQVTVSVFWRPDTNKEWIPCGTKEFLCDESDPFRSLQPLSFGMPIKIDGSSARKAQFRVDWTGYMEIDALRILTSSDDPRNGQEDGDPECQLEPDDMCNLNVFRYLKNGCAAISAAVSASCTPPQPTLVKSWIVTTANSVITGIGRPGTRLASTLEGQWYINDAAVSGALGSGFVVPYTVAPGDIIRQDRGNKITVEAYATELTFFFALMAGAGGSFDLTDLGFPEQEVKWRWSNYVNDLQGGLNVLRNISSLYAFCGFTFPTGDLGIPKVFEAGGGGVYLLNYNFTADNWVAAGATLGLKGDGSTMYLDSLCAQDAVDIPTPTNGQRGIAVMVTESDPSTSQTFMGSNEGAALHVWEMAVRSSDIQYTSSGDGSHTVFDPSPADYTGFWSGTGTDGYVTASIWKNGVSVATAASATTFNLVEATMFLFATNGHTVTGGDTPTITNYSASRIALAFMKRFTTAEQELELYTKTMTFLTGLGYAP